MNVMQKTVMFLLFLFNCAPVLALTPTEEYLRQYSEAIQEGSDGVIAGTRVAAVSVLPDFYARRGFRPVWADTSRFQALLAVLRGATGHGLDPADYHYQILSEWAPDSEDPRQQAERDILATDALIRYGYHLHFGKVDPASLDPDWNLTRRLHQEDPVAVIEAAVAAPSLDTFLDTELAPNGPFYTGLRQALARYREIAGTGGWPLVPGGPTLQPGDKSDRVIALRARLAVTESQLGPQVEDPALYDPPLVVEVERFQRHHGLEADGAVGRRTLAALNIPVKARIDQLRVNLERTRWVFRDLEPRYLIVNIAGFHAYLMQNGKSIWDSRVVVGTPYRKTPVFKAKMTYLVLNPTWTVPPTILKQDIIPAIHRDPGYLASRNMVLLDASGRQVNTADIDLQSLTANSFPYVVRQEPGPQNALGRIKFMFPNSHFVYLHDTPSRDLFKRADRTFSSGCIRVEHPLTLAELLLNDPVNWSRAKLEERLAERHTQTVSLKTPIMVFLVYLTAEPEADGEVNFFNDVYGRDPAVLQGLRGPFHFIPLRQP
jgi:murein L,D-transpeptidase YcbB/YkuD